MDRHILFCGTMFVPAFVLSQGVVGATLIGFLHIFVSMLFHIK